MALPGSGPLSIGDIVTEKGGTPTAGGNYSLQTLSTTDINSASAEKPDGVSPHALSEFYLYDHDSGPPSYTEFNTQYSEYVPVYVCGLRYWTPETIYSSDAILEVGSSVYSDSLGSTPAPDGWYSIDGIEFFSVVSGLVSLIADCETAINYTPTIELSYNETDSIAVCSGTPSTYYSYTDILGLEDYLYTDPLLDSATPSVNENLAPDGFYSDGDTVYEIGGGDNWVVDIFPCDTPPTYNEFELYFDASSATTACNSGTPVTKYSLDTVLTNSSVIWNNNDGTGVPTNGFYSDLTNVWSVTAGVLSGEDECYVPPDTLFEAGTLDAGTSAFGDACSPNVFDKFADLYYYSSEGLDVGTVMYEEIGGDFFPFDGGDDWWGPALQPASYTVYRINSSGSITGVEECS